MFRARIVVAVPILLTLSAVSPAQSANSSTATCNLDDGRQVRINYTPVSPKNDKAPNGRPWAPGGAPMTLFTEAPLSFANATIPIGAYTVYPIPGKDKWSLAVNKNVTAGAAYDEKQDISPRHHRNRPRSPALRCPRSSLRPLGSKCTLRIYFGKTATFADFIAK